MKSTFPYTKCTFYSNRQQNLGREMKILAENLDGWLRRRIRTVVWKSWKHVRTRFKNLRKLGLDKSLATEWANTRKGYWRISASPILQRTLTNKILEKRGLVSISAIYSKR